MTADPAAADRFVTEVDAAAVYVNASTRFTDGAEYGMGAEIGHLDIAPARSRAGCPQRTDHNQVCRSRGRPGARLSERNPETGLAVSCICDAQ